MFLVQTFLDLNLSSFIFSDLFRYSFNGLVASSPLEDRNPMTISTTSKHSLRFLIDFSSMSISLRSPSASGTCGYDTIIIVINMIIIGNFVKKGFIDMQ